MLTSQAIANEIYQSRRYSADLLTELVRKRNQGEDTCQCKRKYIVFLKWIEIAESYLSENFSSGQPIADPAVVCLTADEIAELIAKMKVMRNGNSYPVNDWILANAYWNDLGFWRDTSNWQDSIPIV